MANVSWSDPGASGNWDSTTNWIGLVGETGSVRARAKIVGMSNMLSNAAIAPL